MFASQFLPKLVTTGILAALMSFGGGDAANALYDVGPGEIPGKPGSIIRVWPLEGGGPGMGGHGARLPPPPPPPRPGRPADPRLRRDLHSERRGARRRTQYHRLGA